MKRTTSKRVAASATAPASRPRATRPRAIPGWVAVLALVVVAVVAAVVWRARHSDSRAQAPGGAGSRDAKSMLDSTRSRFLAHDWVGGLALAHEMNVAFPGTSNLLLNEALAWHNYAREGVDLAGGRSATRTSLDRIECEKRAFALLDSAYQVAPDEATRANIDRWRGAQYELLGFSMDAIAAHDAACKRAPGHREALQRAAWLQRLLIRPGDPGSVTAKDAEPRP